ncbi:hypothetical protein HW555_004433 [Spodoptera exigua]|uniref:THAP-type domain-containing protein n=1 Tax=Spodoptera exigua TaxID=7107 RepID=A0A835L8E6_SPOEX|nr:hypothetical protein HW555_004433 [Spodoptera exigua]
MYMYSILMESYRDLKCQVRANMSKSVVQLLADRLPTDGVLKQKWLNVIKTQRCEKYWLPTAYTKVCSKHFSDDDIYMTKKNYRRIKKTAVPIISEDLDYFSSPTILEHVQVSEEGSIFESPRRTRSMN